MTNPDTTTEQEAMPTPNSNEELKSIFVDYGVEPHWCGAEECEASRNTTEFMKALEVYVSKQDKSARVDELYRVRNIVKYPNGKDYEYHSVIAITNRLEQRIAELSKTKKLKEK